MDLRIMEKRFLEKGRQEGREAEREEMAQILREEYNMTEEQIAEIKAKAAARKEKHKA